MPRKKNSLFDSITMFGKTLPEILADAGMDDEEIEMFRERFNANSPETHIFRVESMETTPLSSAEQAWEDEEIEENPKLAKLKESMKKGFTPPEDK